MKRTLLQRMREADIAIFLDWVKVPSGVVGTGSGTFLYSWKSITSATRLDVFSRSSGGVLIVSVDEGVSTILTVWNSSSMKDFELVERFRMPWMMRGFYTSEVSHACPRLS